jgi:putative ABC transport system permease protein
MLRNILLVTWRNLRRNKVVTFINIAGLAAGIAAFIIISAYVRFEKSYDHMLGETGNIYRVESRFYKGDHLTDDWATSTNGYATAMKKDLPEIMAATRINWNNSERVVKSGDMKYREMHVCFADSNFFHFFSYPLLKGNPATVLSEVNTVVISQSTAKKYFGDQDPVGKFLDITTLGDSYRCMVKGVFQDNPPNSTMRFNILVSWTTMPPVLRDFWYIHESYTFVKLAPGINPASVENKFPALAEKYKTGESLRELKWAIQLVPLADIHLKPAKQYEIEAKGNDRAVTFLSVMAYIILLIACINYINLSTARAIDRAREVGIRKVSGARGSQLVFQFLAESLIINLIALAGAVLLVWLARYSLPPFLNTEASGNLLFDQSLYIRLVLIFVAAVLLTGIYPATVLAGVKPITVLKGRYSFSKRGVFLRKGMVAFQFTASLLLMAGTFAVYRQIVYMNRENTGAAISQTLVMKTPVKTDSYRDKLNRFSTSLQVIPGVKMVTGSGSVPGKEVGKFLANRRFGAPKSEERTYEMLRVDFDFIKAYELSVVAGREFDRTRPADSTGIILNEAAVQQLGFASAEKAVGQKVWLETLDKRPNEVIGVIKNYHQQSLQKNYTPVILFMDPALGWIPADFYSVKIASGQEYNVAASVKKVWDRTFPESSFDFFFLDEFYDRQYRQDIQFGRIFLLFSSLAILIACMGLFGLTAYSTARRTKEIGVRKVLGASVSNILSLLTWDITRLIIGCSLLAIPLAYLFITQWLNNYAFRVSLTWWQFILPVLALVIIAITTISYLTFKAALANPALTLRDE